MDDEERKHGMSLSGHARNRHDEQIEEGRGIDEYAVLDFEASSLSVASWPIEVGLSWFENGEVQTWSSLIRPAARWDRSDWSEQSAAVHRISFSELEDAPCPIDVATELFSRLGNRILLSDAPTFEVQWLGSLLDAARYTTAVLPVQNYHDASFALFEGFALDMLYETLERRAAPHRAGPDSARLARAWLVAVRYSR